MTIVSSYCGRSATLIFHFQYIRYFSLEIDDSLFLFTDFFFFELKTMLATQRYTCTLQKRPFRLQITCFFIDQERKKLLKKSISLKTKMSHGNSQSPFSLVYFFMNTSLLFRGPKHSRTEDMQSQPQLWELQGRGRDLSAV